MIVMDIPKLEGRKLHWVRAVVDNYVITCADDDIKRKVESLKPIGGPPTEDPEPDWTLGRECRLWLHARIITKTAHGTPDGGEGVLC